MPFKIDLFKLSFPKRSNSMNLKEQVIAVLQHTNMQPGGLKFSEGHGEVGTGFTDSKSIERFYLLRVESVQFLGTRNEKLVVEFTRSSNWDDGKETGPMVFDTVEVIGDVAADG
jgi:hypothetical protein